MILMHINHKIVIKTGHIDFESNFFNKWYINPAYFNGIEKILQNIAAENEGWNFGRSLGVVCRIVENLVKNTRIFYMRNGVIKLMEKIISKV